jgi:8-oxo-dGTP pyrophosphatase MutT (NUDIX family)
MMFACSSPILIVCTIYHYFIGGRLLKGETFFAAATRKAKEETGLTNVTPIQVLGVWNTFFPTSNWDTDTKKGTQTVNPIVLVELNDDNETNANLVQLDSTSENYRWISLDPKAATEAGEDRYVLQALLRLQAWDPSYI